MLAAAVILTSLIASVSGAAEPDVFAAVIEIEPRDGKYDGYYCPTEMAEDEICLGSSILIQRGRIVRFIGRRPTAQDKRMSKARSFDVDGPFVQFRMIGGHAARRIAAGRYVAVLEPTDKPYLFVQWSNELDGRKICFPASLFAHYGARLPLELGPGGKDGERCEISR